MNVQAANKIAAELAVVQAEWETLADLDTTSARIARMGVLIEQEKELREALRVARSSNAKGWSAKLAAANID